MPRISSPTAHSNLKPSESKIQFDWVCGVRLALALQGAATPRCGALTIFVHDVLVITVLKVMVIIRAWWTRSLSGALTLFSPCRTTAASLSLSLISYFF